MDNSKIEWTDATWNPLGGCTRVTGGCVNCYAEIMAARFSLPGQWGHGLARRVKLPDGRTDHRWTGEVRLIESKLDQPLHWRRPRRIFVNSTSDTAHEKVTDDMLCRIFATMALTRWHTYQVLTKRPERLRAFILAVARNPYLRLKIAGAMCEISGHPNAHIEFWYGNIWPLPNVWLGTSVEDQATADQRIPHLLATPAAIRFISAEPLLGPVDVEPYLYIYTAMDDHLIESHPDEPLPYRDPATINPRDIVTPRLDWVITGGESGPGARPAHHDWFRSIRDQCVAAGVAYFHKQNGEWVCSGQEFESKPGSCGPAQAGWVRPDGHWRTTLADDAHLFCEAPGSVPIVRVGKARAGRLLDGRTWDQMPGVADAR